MSTTDYTLSKKRRYQPPITNFFNSSDQSDTTTSSNLTHNHYSAPTYSGVPAVPGKVQASLLGAGMRVRKAVPGGYKTKPGPEEKLMSSADVAGVQSENARSVYPHMMTHTCRPAELAPYGMDRNQPLSEISSNRVTDSSQRIFVHGDDGDAFSLPASSQDSVVSVSSSTGVKRTYDFDREVRPFGSAVQDVEVPPALGRTILAPSLGQQRRLLAASSKGGMEVDDFEEASFLLRREDVEGEDIEM